MRVRPADAGLTRTLVPATEPAEASGPPVDDPDDPYELRRGPRPKPPPELPDGRGRGIRIGLAEVKGINDAEVERIVTGRPYGSLSDFWHRASVSRPVVERLVVAGAFDEIYGIGRSAPVRRRGGITRRDLLLQVGELDHWARATAKAARKTGTTAKRPKQLDLGDTAARAARQSQATRPIVPVCTQLTLDLGDAPGDMAPSGLPEMTGAELVRAELDVLGLDASRHVVDFYEPFLRAAGITRARDLLNCRSGQQVLVAGVKVATQTPPIRSGRRVVFLTLDDATGPLDATFFEDAQAGYASTIFHSWLLVIRGQVRRTGPRGVSLLGQGCWELPLLSEAWSVAGLDAVADLLARPAGWDNVSEAAVAGAAQSRSVRPVASTPPLGPGQVFSTGYRKSDYVDIKPSGGDAKSAPRKLWHSSSGSSGG